MSRMFRNLCPLQRNFSIFTSSINGNNALLRTVRMRSNITVVKKSASIRTAQKQSVEVVKWVLLVIPVTSFGLGCWQLYRLQWKLDLISMMQAQTNSTPVDMPTDYEQLKSMEYRPLKVRGEFLHDKEFLIGPRSLIEPNAHKRSGSLISDPKKNQGWLVITPFKLKETGDVILINRGWVPHRLKSKEARQSSMVKGEIELVGIVRLSETRKPFMPKNMPEKGTWFYRNLEEISAHIGCLPVWLDVRGIPDPPEGWPQPNQTNVTLRNEHFSYLVTWYLLAVFTSVMWHRYFIKRLPLL